jgi:hypothetical protein
MEILILIAVIATGASGLYVAYTFKTHIERYVEPLMQRTAQDARTQIEAVSTDLKQQIQASTGQLEAVTTKDPMTNGELSQQIRAVTDGLQREIRAITGELQRDRELVGRIDQRQVQLGEDLSEADRRVAQLGESLARQGAQLTAIYSYAKNQGKLTGTSREIDQLMLAMLEAESHVDGKGWGTPPHLFALTERMPSGPADHEHSAGTPDALIPVTHELPHGDLVEVLASTHWPEDVVGCVLVAELTDLPARGEDDALIDPVAAGQWASARPDGRPARLAVGVRRNGEHVCGFRVKGEHDVQVRADIAGDIVTALLGTF